MHQFFSYTVAGFTFSFKDPVVHAWLSDDRRTVSEELYNDKKYTCKNKGDQGKLGQLAINCRRTKPMAADVLFFHGLTIPWLVTADRFALSWGGGGRQHKMLLIGI